jgi:hypothetical protein
LARHGRLDIAHEPSLKWPPHAQPLSAAGRALLGALVRALATERIDPERPDTFPRTRKSAQRSAFPLLRDRVSGHSSGAMDWTIWMYGPGDSASPPSLVLSFDKYNKHQVRNSFRYTITSQMT